MGMMETKPNLFNGKFEQFSGETLTLSGTTEIHGTFEIENGGVLIINDDNQNDGYVLTSDSSGIANWKALTITGATIPLEISNRNIQFDYTNGNICLGDDALSGITSGTDNVAIGCDSLLNNDIGGGNIAIGCAALKTNKNYGNVGIGYGSMSIANSGSQRNIGIGECSLRYVNGNYNIGFGFTAGQLITGSNNVVLGQCALHDGNSDNNIAIGCRSLKSNNGGGANVAIGRGTLTNNTIGINNVAIGNSAGYGNVIGNYSIAIGDGSMTASSGGTFNIGLGYNSLRVNRTGIKNIGIGDCTLYNNLSSNCNVAIGGCSLYFNETGNNNVGIGQGALFCNVGGHCNVAIGRSAMLCNSSGHKNIGIGDNALTKNNTGLHNVGIGERAIYNNDSGCHNVALGQYSLSNNRTGNFNIGIGNCTQFYNTGGTNNVALGWNTLQNNKSGNYNIGLGRLTLRDNCGHCNVAIGEQAGLYGQNVCDNVAFGTFSSHRNEDGKCNISIGHYSLYTNVTGCTNIAIGKSSGRNTTGNGNLFLGNCAGYYEEGDNKIIIGHDINNPIICADQTAQTLKIAGDLTVSGLTLTDGNEADGYVLTSDASGNASWQSGGTGGSTPPGGTTGQLQYNDGSVFGGTGLEWDDSTNTFKWGTSAADSYTHFTINSYGDSYNDGDFFKLKDINGSFDVIRLTAQAGEYGIMAIDQIHGMKWGNPSALCLSASTRVQVDNRFNIVGQSTLPSSGNINGDMVRLTSDNNGIYAYEGSSWHDVIGKKEASVTVFASTEDVVTGDGTIPILISEEMDNLYLYDVMAGTTVPTTGGTTTDIQIRRVRSGTPTNLLSTAVTLANDEYFANDGTINLAQANINKGDVIFVDVDAAGTGGKGLYVTLTFSY